MPPSIAGVFVVVIAHVGMVVKLQQGAVVAAVAVRVGKVGQCAKMQWQDWSWRRRLWFL